MDENDLLRAKLTDIIAIDMKSRPTNLAARAKDALASDSARGNWETVRRLFRDDVGRVPANDYRTIEFLIRQGYKKLDRFARPEVSGASTFHVPRTS